MTGRLTLASLLAGIGAILLLATALVAPALFADVVSRMDVAAAGTGPSAEHWFGTDDLGRDVFARTLAATQLSLGLALAATAIRVVLGVAIGMWLSLSGSLARSIGTRIIDTALSFPAILIAIVITTIVGPSIEGAVLGVGLAGVPTYARLGYTMSSAIVGRDYVAAAKALGLGRIAILWRHVLPNIADTLAVSTATSLGLAIVEIASLSFLGLGVNPPAFDWGRMLIEGAEAIYVNPAAALGPAAAIALSGLIFSYLGEAIALWIQPMRSRSLASGSGIDSAAGAIAPLRLAGGEDTVLLAENLSVAFPTGGSQTIAAVRNVGLSIGRGETVGLVGESGSGKTLTAMALAGLTGYPARVSSDRMLFTGEDLTAMSGALRERLLGTGLAVVFQDPSTSLNPALRIREQMTEAVRHHRGLSEEEASALALEQLALVGITEPGRRLDQYPHEFSGGMRQRAMIAMGLMMRPSLIVADEPTTALDVTVQAQILALLREANGRDGTAILMISHDLAVISQVCDRVLVMYGGRIVESGPVEQVIGDPAHPYTRALIGAIPDLDTPRGQRLVEIPGQPPVIGAFPRGCSFQERCPARHGACAVSEPPQTEIGSGRVVACWLHAAPDAEPDAKSGTKSDTKSEAAA
ncbi:dipeptide/oligopeptide/nickel ABC transporter permease/ATP-binding protein [Bosea sp. 2YAB26]|uniref:dipeptide/oligopeptide/nickel ABC transporter permease/ATP-binding protein n=1 Tax=Bosea sp. 2YAB26 TaxID=3237478 RepID=UPI003F9163EF